MASQVTNYQCPKCTGPLHFDSETGKLVCDYCGSTYEVSEIEALYAKKDEKAAEAKKKADEKEAKEKTSAAQDDFGAWETSAKDESWGENGEKFKTYTCPSCGAELVCDDSTAVTQCPYCGNPSVIPGQFTGALKPDYVIPFKMKKEDAVQALKNHYKGKYLLPKSFVDGNHIEKIQGVYVPFWMFDGRASGTAVFETTNVSSYTSGDYRITETKHYTVTRGGTIAFEKVPADGSSKMPDDTMDSIEPYDYSELQPFSTAYMPGYLADKFDVSMEECSKRADQRVENTLYSELQDTVTGYDTCNRQSGNCHLDRGTAYYAMMPVWLLNTKWNGKDFLFAMNGQTGKMVGDLPINWGKFWATFFAIAVPLSVIFSLIASAL